MSIQCARQLVMWAVMVMAMVMVGTAEAKTLVEWMEDPEVDDYGNDNEGEIWNRGITKERNDNDDEVIDSDDDSGESYSDEYNEIMTYRDIDSDSEMSYSMQDNDDDSDPYSNTDKDNDGDKKEDDNSKTLNADTDDNSDINNHEKKMVGSSEIKEHDQKKEEQEEEMKEENEEDKKRLPLVFIETAYSLPNATHSSKPRFLGYHKYSLKRRIKVFMYTFTDTHTPTSKSSVTPETPLPLLPLPKNHVSQSPTIPIPRPGTLPPPPPPQLPLNHPLSLTPPLSTTKISEEFEPIKVTLSHADPQQPSLPIKTSTAQRKEAGKIHRRKKNVKTDKDDHKRKQTPRVLVKHRSKPSALIQPQNKGKL
ncbi:hypothetical protein E2C01_087654 [Portunus trituberculatus]|uniref:Uncharacterized protein n=1 Tax=Portunus trituberculatus TaxID=210409 RepID=A0A5B7JC95_PORTR|nr:hypothetical protein [Portunus trituberculatus]